MSAATIILNRKYNVYNIEFIPSEYKCKFFDYTFIPKTTENANALWLMFHKNIYNLDKNQRFDHTVHYINFLESIPNFKTKPEFYQIIMNIDYHMNNNSSKWKELKAKLL